MNISILGCGWYGRALARSLLQKGYHVKGSATSLEKLTLLASAKINPCLVKITAEEDSIIDVDFFNCEILVVAFNTKMNDTENYLAKIRNLVSLIHQHQVKKIIFISSISVYGDHNTVVNESSIPQPQKNSGKSLLAAELLLTRDKFFTTSVIRFGGLAGPGRDPANFLAGKTLVPNGLAPINLIHLEDCIGITESVIRLGAGNGLFNAVAPHHPAKMDFYTRAAKKHAVLTPSFIEEKNQWKIVETIHLPVLHYKFIVSNWFDWLKTQ
ncbi:MAG: NAD(P)H-binding protein [Chitinophagaceae bacterium]